MHSFLSSFTPPVLKKKKKEKEVLKNLQKKRLKKQTPYRTRVVVRHTRTNNTTRKRERKSDERARERARERATGERRRCFLFFSRAGTSHPSRFFKTRFRGGRWKTKRHLRFVSVFDYNTQSARDVHIHR